MIRLLLCAILTVTLLHGYTPPGRFVKVGGRKLYLHCTGKGKPTVVLVAGGGAYALDWSLVQPEIAQKTRVCSYDRAGLGWSDPGPADETVEQTVSDLHTLLHAAGERGPYILTGASIGGIFIQAYRRVYPREVAGLVFTNSSNRVGFMVNGKAGLLWELSEADITSQFPLPAATPRAQKPVREDDPFNRLPPELQSVRLEFDIRLWEKSDPSKATPASTVSWGKEFRREFNEMDAVQNPPLGNLPVVVLSSEPAADEPQRKARDAAAARLDFLSAKTAHITAVGSGHEIHLYRPGMVVEAVLRCLGMAR